MQNKSSIFWGIVLIIIGVVFLGNNFTWWDIDIFFDGWWTLLIIILSIYGIYKKDNIKTSIITLILGVLLLLASQDIIDWSMIWKILVPVIIIMIGLSFMFGSFKSKIKKASSNAEEYVAVFGGIEEKIKEVNKDFRVIAIFGGVELDLRKAKINKDITIECISVFGGIDLRLPDNVQVQTSGVPIFGGTENKYENNQDSNVTIYINYTCIFGGVDVI